MAELIVRHEAHAGLMERFLTADARRWTRILFVYLAWLAVRIPGAVARPVVTARSRGNWPEI